MNDQTPKRTQSINPFSPVTLRQSPLSASSASSHRNLTGLQKLAHDLSIQCYNDIQKWNEIHIKGCFIVKEIVAFKGDNLKYFQAPLVSLMDDLCSAVYELELMKDRFNMAKTRAKAMADVQQYQDQVLVYLNGRQLANLIKDLAESFESALMDMKLVQENIAHCPSKEEAMFYASIWTYQCNVWDNINVKLEILIIETGLKKNT